MRILVTGAKGFVGKNLCSQLKNIKEGKARFYGDLIIDAVYEYDLIQLWGSWINGVPIVTLYLILQV